MATATERPKPHSRAADRELIALAKVFDLETIVEKTGMNQKVVLKKARRLGLSIKGKAKTRAAR
jgi:hypothetical protein